MHGDNHAFMSAVPKRYFHHILTLALQSMMLDVEADCYWCLSKLLEGIQDHYTYAQPGIQRTVFRVKELIRSACVLLMRFAMYCHSISFVVLLSGNHGSRRFIVHIMLSR